MPFQSSERGRSFFTEQRGERPEGEGFSGLFRRFPPALASLIPMDARWVSAFVWFFLCVLLLFAPPLCLLWIGLAAVVFFRGEKSQMLRYVTVCSLLWVGVYFAVATGLEIVYWFRLTLLPSGVQAVVARTLLHVARNAWLNVWGNLCALVAFVQVGAALMSVQCRLPILDRVTMRFLNRR